MSDLTVTNTPASQVTNQKQQIGDGNPDGIQIGATSSDLVGFYGTTPIVQRSGAAEAAVTTTASQTTTPYGYSTSTQADGIVTLLNEIRATLVALGLMKGSA